jgi:hypothetical protein
MRRFRNGTVKPRESPRPVVNLETASRILGLLEENAQPKYRPVHGRTYREGFSIYGIALA